MPFDVGANLVILVVVLVGPFLSHRVESNLEAFLFVMGTLSALASRVLTAHLIADALRHPIPITLAVLLAGVLFTWGRRWLDAAVEWAGARLGFQVLAAAATALLGLASSVITAIIAALVLVEIISKIRLRRSDEVRIVVLSCFAIGLGAALTPVGEPLSTIATAKLNQDFWYLMRLLGVWVTPALVVLGIVAWAHRPTREPPEGLREIGPPESYRGVLIRAVRVYLFVMALTLLGEGFKPLIDRYVIGLDARVLFWINTVSAILDNATLTAAEISARMSQVQVRAVLMGLLISGGMLIPGNIPNIISAGKLGIKSREWARDAVPIGAILMVLYFVLLFVI